MADLEIRIDGVGRGSVKFQGQEIPCTGFDIQMRPSEPNRVALYVLPKDVYVSAEAPNGWRLEDLFDG